LHDRSVTTILGQGAHVDCPWLAVQDMRGRTIAISGLGRVETRFRIMFGL
jgi:hypothetical protein